jgi:hypothetical protein
MPAIRTSPDGRYFVDEDGAPFFWLGDTQWQLLRDFSPDDAREVLRRRKEQGFSTVQIMVTGAGEGTVPNTFGETPWLDGDPAAPNEAYFDAADKVIAAADDEGLVLVLGVFHQVQRARLTTANARPYARWVANRWADPPHIVWSMYPEATAEFVPVLRELAAGLREGDGGAHMITVHPDPSPTSSSFIHEEEWLDFNSIQTWHDGHLIPPMVGDDYARTPVKPAVMAEGKYEGARPPEEDEAFAVRRQAYWSYLVGGHHSYGHDSNWTSPATWRSWIDSPGVACLGVCRDVLTGLHEWWRLIPDRSVLPGSLGTGTALNVAAGSASSRWALAYLGSPEPFHLRAPWPGSSDASWIDPATGGRTPIGALPAGETSTLHVPDGWKDALLLLEPSAPA